MERMMKMSKKKKQEQENEKEFDETNQDESHEELKVLSELEQALETIASLEKQLEQSKNDYLKAYADTQNTRKRLMADFESRSKFAVKNFALEVVNVMDNFERAMVNPTEDSASIRKGIEMIYQQLLDVMSKEGIKVIDAVNSEFNPNLHHAIVSEETDQVEPNTVMEVFQKGYMINDKLLRPSVVKVSERKSEEE